MHKTTNLQKLREYRNLTPEQLSGETGVSADAISGAESGKTELTTEELYDLALYFQTGTSDLVDSEELAVTTALDFPGNEAFDGFWGHLGVLLPGQQHTRWYPVTTRAAEAVMDDLQSYEKGFVAIRTLNERVLFVNPQLVKKMMLNDDDADAPPDFEDVARYMSPASYQAIREWYFERIGLSDAPYSSKARELVESLLKEEELDEERIEQLILSTFIYYHDGSSESYYADGGHLANIWALGYNMEVPAISIPERNGVFHCWFSGKAVAFIDTPYLELEEIQQESSQRGTTREKGEKIDRTPARTAFTGKRDHTST